MGAQERLATSVGGGERPVEVFSAGRHFCVPGMFSNLWVKVPIQPDGGEGLAKRKGIVVRRCLKEAWSKTAT